MIDGVEEKQATVYRDRNDVVEEKQATMYRDRNRVIYSSELHNNKILCITNRTNLLIIHSILKIHTVFFLL